MSQTSIGGSSFHINADATGVSQGLAQAKKDITGFHARIGGLFRSLPGMAKAGLVGGVAGIGAMFATGAMAGAAAWWDRITDGIEAYQEKAVMTVKASKILGESIEGISKVAYAVGGIDAAKEAIQELSETMGAGIAGEQGAIDLFKSIGTSAEELADLPVDERLLKIAQAMSKLSNFEQLDVGKKLFKRYADDILPLIAEGPEKIQQRFARGMDLGLVVDEQSAKAAFSYQRAKNRIIESTEGMWQAMAPGLMRGLEPLANGIDRFIEPYFKKTGQVYSHLGDLFAGTAPVFEKHLSSLLSRYNDTLDSMDPKTYATDYAKTLVSVLAGVVDFTFDFTAGFTKAIATIYWGIDKLELGLIQVARVARVSESITGGSIFTDAMEGMRDHRKRNKENIKDMRGFADGLLNWDANKFKQELNDAIDKTNAELANAEPAVGDPRRMDWVAKMMKKFEGEAVKIEEELTKSTKSIGIDSQAAKIEELAGKYSKLNEQTAPMIDNLMKLGAIKQVTQIHSDLTTSIEGIGKTELDKKIDSINRSFGVGAAKVRDYLDEIRELDRMKTSIERGLNLAKGETFDQKLKLDYQGLMDAFNANKINEEQLALAANALIPSTTAAQNSRATAAMYGSKESAESSFNYHFKALEKPDGPMDRVANEITRQRELHKQNVDNGKSILLQLQKMEVAGQI